MKMAALIATIIVVLGGAAGNYLRISEQKPDRPADFGLLPLKAGDFVGEERCLSETSYDVLKADATTLRRYVDSDGAISWLFIAYFGSQKYGSQIHSPKHCLPGGGWKIDQLQAFPLPLPDGRIKNVNRVSIRTQNARQLMFYWFETRSGSVREEFGIKLDLMKNSLLLRPTDAAFVRLTVPVQDGDIDAATDRAIEFFRVFHADIENALPFGD